MNRSKDPKALGSWLSKPSNDGGGSMNASKTFTTTSSGFSGSTLSNPSNHSSVTAEKSRHTARSANSSRRSLLSMPEEFCLSAAPVSPLHSPSGRSSRSKMTSSQLYPRVPEISEHEEDILWEHPLQHDGILTVAAYHTGGRSALSSRHSQSDIVLTQPVNKSPPPRRLKKSSSSLSGIPKAPPTGNTPRSSRKTEYDLSGGLQPLTPTTSSSSRQFASPLPLQVTPSPAAKPPTPGPSSLVPQSIVLQKQVPTTRKGSHPRRDQQQSAPDSHRKAPPPQEIVLDNAFWQSQTKVKAGRAPREHPSNDEGYDETTSRTSSRLQGSVTSINYDPTDRFNESEASALAAQEEEMMLLALELSLADQNSTYQLDFNDSGDGCSLSVHSARNALAKNSGVQDPGPFNPDGCGVSLSSGRTYYVCVPQQSSAPGTSVASLHSKAPPSESHRAAQVEQEGYCGDSVTSHRVDDRSFLGREDMTMNSDEEREMIELAMERSMHDGDSMSQLSRPQELKRDVSLSTVYLRNDVDGAHSASYARIGAHGSRSEAQQADIGSSQSERSGYGHQSSAHSRDRFGDRVPDDLSYGSRYSMRDARWAANLPSQRRVNGSSSHSRNASIANGSSTHSRRASGGYYSANDHDERYRASDRSEPYRLNDDSEYQRIASYAQPSSASTGPPSHRSSSQRQPSRVSRAGDGSQGPPRSIGFYATPANPPARPTSSTRDQSSWNDEGASHRRVSSLRAKFENDNEGQLPDIVVRSARRTTQHS